MLHAAFFEVLGVLPGEGEPRWADVLAGLVTLRLVDRWADGNAQGRLTRPALTAVAQAVHAIDPHAPVRAALQQIVDAIRSTLGAVHPHVDVLGRVLTYAHALRLNADWALAADAYRTVIATAREPAEQELVPEAYDRLGYCLRMQGAIDEALEAYAAGRAIAEAQRNVAVALRIRVSEANVSIYRGNFPEAEQILDEVISAAYTADLASVAAPALHDRGIVAHARGQTERAIQWYHEALIHATDMGQRDRLLADLGRAFGDLGARDAAREALLLLYATGSAQVDRWVAAINLLELAALDAQETVFEEYRRELARAALPPRYEAFYQLFVGEGCARFGRSRCARTAFERAMSIAAQHDINEVLMRAEAGCEAVKRHRELPRGPERSEVPETVAHVATALRMLREQQTAAAPS
jgi:tetratricopeptide (TPR) repeat protein